MAIQVKSAPLKKASKPKISLDMQLSQKKAKIKDRILFTERLSLLLETGVPLHDCIDLLYHQEPVSEMKDILNDIKRDISSGDSFSIALSKHKQIFPSTYINLIMASEKGGFLHQVLIELVAMDEKNVKFRNTIKSAMFYPVFLSIFSVAVVVFVLTFIFPKFADMFADIRDQLPATTILFMAASDLLRNYWHYLILGINLFGISFLFWIKKASGQTTIDHLKLKIPVLKHVFIQIYMIQILRTMGISLSHGVPITDTLASCQEAVSNCQIRQFINDLRSSVSQGEGIAAGFRDSPFVPPMLTSMVATGEASGNLALVMERIAKYYDQELEKRLNTLSKMIEPIMLLVMGLLVGLIVSSLILPIFKLSRAVS